MPTDRPIRWGIVATGKIARRVAGQLRLLENAELTAVSSRSLGRAQAFADEFGVTRAYDSPADLAAAGDVDVVYIAAPHAQHAEIMRTVIDAGKAVLCEKAFTTSLADTEAVAGYAAERGVFCMEAMWTRFIPLIIRARRIVAEGGIGRVRSVAADLGFVAPADPRHRLWDPALGGGALLDVGIYPVAFAQMLLGSPSSVAAVGSLTDLGVDAEAGLLLGWDDGAHATLSASLIAAVGGGAVIVGTEGRIEIPPRFHHPTTLVHVRSTQHGVEEAETFSESLEGRGHVPMLRAVASAVREGRTGCPEMPLSDTVEVMRILDAALHRLGVSYPEPAPVAPMTSGPRRRLGS